MTNQEILDKAIRKAVINGWDKTVGVILIDNTESSVSFIDVVEGVQEVRKHVSLNDLIFNHVFARALWGEKQIPHDTFDIYGNRHEATMRAWKYYLQEMVLSEDPISYLGAHLD